MNIFSLRNSVGASVFSAILMVSLFVPVFAVIAIPTTAEAAISVVIDTINGVPPTGHCIAGEITIVGHGTTGTQGGPYELDLGWGDGATTTLDKNSAQITSGTLQGANEPFSFTVTHIPVGPSTGLTVFLHHSQPSGNDAKTIVISQCIAAPTEGVLVVSKNVVGGTAVPSDFSLHVTSGNTDVAGSPFPGQQNGTDFKLVTGSYTVSEDAETNYQQTSIACVNETTNTPIVGNVVNLQAGKNYSCVITNTFTPPAPGTLKIVKEVVNNNGGNLQADDFSFSVNNGSATAFNANGENSLSVAPGQYTVTETANSAYATTYNNCSNVTVQSNQTTTCTITNDDKAGTLVVTKHVINDNGGTKNASDFTLSVTGTNVSDSSFPGDESGTSITLDAGVYSADETEIFGYNKSLGSNCSGTIANGETKNCTITNNDVAPKLTVVKLVENLYRGTKSVIDFALSVGFTPVLSGVSTTFNAGSFLVSETGSAGYIGTFSDDCDQNGNVSLAVGEEKTCTLTNTDIEPGTLKVVKHVVTDNPSGFEGLAQADQFTISVTGGNPAPASFSGSETGVDVVVDGTAAYSVVETGGPLQNYGVTYSPECSGVMTPGATVTCTITNNDVPPTVGSLTVVKQVVNDNGGSGVVGDFTLTVSDNDEFSANVTSGVSNLYEGGSYSVSEGPHAGYTLSFSGDCDSNGNVTVVNGESKTCTVINNDIAPSLTLIKNVTKDNGGEALATEWTLGATGNQETPTVISGEGGVVSGPTFQAGTYTLSESEGPSGYVSGDWSCSGVENVDNTITLTIGQSATCEITNDDKAGTLVVTKHVINDNGGTKNASDFTLHVEREGNDPATFSGNEEGTEVSVNAGAYSVSEDAESGYGMTLGEGCEGTIANGETKYCTVTNDDGKATLVIVKETLGANGAFDFTLTQDETTIAEKTIETINNEGSETLAIDAGEYTLTEVVPIGWTLDSVTCEYDEESIGESVQNGKFISIDSGDTVTCTFVNDATDADLSVTKSVDDTTPDAGQTIEYTLSAHNAGPAAATNITVLDVLPSDLTYVSDDGLGAYSTSTGEWIIATLPSGSTTALHIKASVKSGTEGKQIANSITVSVSDEDVSDYNEQNNSAASTVIVNTPTPPTPPSGGGGGSSFPPSNGPPGGISFGGGGSGLGASTGPTGQVLGVSAEQCSQYLTSYIRFGNPSNNSEQVKRLQRFLSSLEGFTGVSETGVYDQASHAAVHAFQTRYKDRILTPWGAVNSTGYVYYTTRKTVNEIYCKFTKEFPLTEDQIAEIERVKNQGAANASQSTPATPRANTLPKSVPTPPSAPSDETPEIGGVENADLPASVGDTTEEGGGILKSIGNFFKKLF